MNGMRRRKLMKNLLMVVFLTVCALATINAQTVSSKPDKKAKKTKPKKEYIKPPDVFPGNGYSHAVSVSGGRTIYVAGQIALNEKGELVGNGDIRAQTQQVFENIKRVLAASGATFDDVVKISYYVKNFNPSVLPAIRGVRDSFLSKDQPPPASTLVGVQSLFRDDILIEIECIAVVK